MYVHNNGRHQAFGNQLIDVHQWLREELASLRDNLDAYLSGEADRPMPLQAHCLTFCQALTRHHTGEDRGPFPALAEQFPELRPTIDRLMQDHDLISGILARMETILTGPDDVRKVRKEIDGLAAIMESHFAYEERTIFAALNALDLPGEGTPEFLRTD